MHSGAVPSHAMDPANTLTFHGAVGDGRADELRADRSAAADRVPELRAVGRAEPVRAVANAVDGRAGLSGTMSAAEPALPPSLSSATDGGKMGA